MKRDKIIEKVNEYEGDLRARDDVRRREEIKRRDAGGATCETARSYSVSHSTTSRLSP
jgi:hypothetical protein